MDRASGRAHLGLDGGNDRVASSVWDRRGDIVAVRYEAGSLQILPGRALRALGWLNLVYGAVVVVLALQGELSWFALATVPLSLPLLTTQVRFDERGVRWRPVRWSSWPTWRGWRERLVAWEQIHDVNIDYATRRLEIVVGDGSVALTSLSLPAPQPDRDVLAAFIERHLARQRNVGYERQSKPPFIPA